MKIRFTAHVVIDSRSYAPGQVGDIDADLAQEFVAKHQAAAVDVAPVAEPEKPKRKRAK